MEESGRNGYDIASILHGMREEYWQGVTEVEEVRGETLECLTFLLGGETYAFETTRAAEVLRVPKLIRVPGVPDVIVGIFNLRGEITATVDIRPLLGLPQPPLTEQGRLIVVKGETFLTGILTEGVTGVEPLSMEGFEPSGGAAAPRNEFIRREVQHCGRLVLLLDIARLMASPSITVAGR